jgi:hypothetical protein
MDMIHTIHTSLFITPLAMSFAGLYTAHNFSLYGVPAAWAVA